MGEPVNKTTLMLALLSAISLSACSYGAAVDKNQFLQAITIYTQDANSLACYLQDHGNERGGDLERKDDAAFYALQVAQANGYHSMEVADAMDKVKQLDYAMVRKGVKDYACNPTRAN